MKNKGEYWLCRGKKEKEGTCHKLRTRGTPSTSALCIPWLRNSARLEKAERATHAGIFAFVRRSQDCAQHFARQLIALQREVKLESDDEKEEREKAKS